MSAVLTLTDCPVALHAHTTTHTRTLHRACEIAGGVAQLADLLDVSSAALARWLTGEEKTPNRVFLAAVDIVLAAPGQTAGSI